MTSLWDNNEVSSLLQIFARNYQSLEYLQKKLKTFSCETVNYTILKFIYYGKKLTFSQIFFCIPSVYNNSNSVTVELVDPIYFVDNDVVKLINSVQYMGIKFIKTLENRQIDLSHNSILNDDYINVYCLISLSDLKDLKIDNSFNEDNLWNSKNFNDNLSVYKSKQEFLDDMCKAKHGLFDILLNSLQL